MEGVPVGYPIDIRWEGGERFSGGRPDGPSLLVDGERAAAPGPVDSLLVALASCSAIDVLEILRKRRTPATDLQVRATFSRAATPPRRLTAVQLHFRVATDSEAHHVERAVELSVEKYCSVVHSLKADIDLGWDVEVVAAGPPSA